MIRRVVSIAAFCALGCGGNSGPAAKDATAAAPADAPVAEPPPDLSPVAPPAELVAFARIARPKTMFETLAVWSGVPVGLSDVLPPEVKELEGVIAWDAPLEAAAVLDRNSSAKLPEPLLVVSLGLVSLDKALEHARDRGAGLSAVAPGVFRVTVHEDVSCAIAAAVGVAPARLVCGEEWPDVEALLPYATRGLPTRDLGANDVHIELVAEPLRRRHAQEIAQLRAMAGLLLRMASLDDQRFDRVLTDVAYALADELKALAGELDRLQFTAKLDATGKTLDVGEALVFRTAGLDRSFLSQMIQDVGRRAAPPPDTYWQLPAKAHSAVYSVGADPQQFTTTLKSVAELLDAYLEHEKIAPSLRKRARRMIEAYSMMFKGGAFASGPSAAKSEFATLGWTVGVMEQRADVITAWLGDALGLLQDRELAKLLKARLDVDPKLMPKARMQALKVNGFPARATAYTFDFPAALMKRLDELESRGSSGDKKSEAHKAAAISVVVVPDGERSFVAYGTDAKELVALLEATRAGKDPKLADLPALAAQRQLRSTYAGFWTIEAFVQYLQDELGERGQQMLARAPNHGKSPWLLHVDIAEQPNFLTVSAVAKIPQGAFQDAGSLLPEAASGLLSLRGGGPQP